MNTTSKLLTALAAASVGITTAQAALIAGDFAGGITNTTAPRLTATELDDGWLSHDDTFVGGSGVATTGTGQAEGHMVSQVFSNTQTGTVALSFEWAPAGSEELNYAVFGYNSASGNLVYINTAFSNNGPAELGGGDTLVATGVGLVAGWTGVTGDTISAAFDITGYTEIAVAFWQPASASGGVLDNVSIDVIPEPSSAALLGLAGCGLLLRRRR